AERRAVAVAPVNRRIERQLGRRDPAQRADGLDRLAHFVGDFLIAGRPPEQLGQRGFGPGKLDEGGILVQRDADGSGLLGKRLEDRLTDPPYGVRNELYALVRIELLDRLEQPLVADADELGQTKATALVLLHVGDHEAKVGGDQALGGFLVTRTCAARQLS